MARLQDFQSVTPAGSDNLLIVQSQGQGLSTLNAVGQKIANDTTMSGLNTTSKFLVGAINELKSGNVVTVGASGQYASFSALGQAISSGQAFFCFYVNPTDLPSGWLNYGMGIAGKWGSIGTRLLVLGIKTDGSANLQTFV